MASNNNPNWTTIFEDVRRDFDENLSNANSVMQLCNPQYGLLKRYQNLSKEQIEELYNRKVNLGTRKVRLYVKKNDWEKNEVDDSVATLPQMGMIMANRSFEQFAHEIIEASYEYVSKTNEYKENYINHAIYLFYLEERNKYKTSAKCYQTLMDHLHLGNVSTDSSNNGKGNIFLIKDIHQNLRTYEAKNLAHIIICDFASSLKLIKFEVHDFENLFEVLADILPFNYQIYTQEIMEIDKQIKERSETNFPQTNNKQEIKGLKSRKENLSKESDLQREKIINTINKILEFFIEKGLPLDWEYHIIEGNDFKTYLIRANNFESLKDITNLYYGLRNLYAHGSSKPTIILGVLSNENPQIEVKVCKVKEKDEYKKLNDSEVIATKINIETDLKNLWRLARCRGKTITCDYITYMNAINFTRYIQSLFGKIISIIMMSKFRMTIVLPPKRDNANRRNIHKQKPDKAGQTIPKKSRLFKMDEDMINEIIARNNWSELLN
jgi:hypothetical protein